jgi:hypothetical protein
MSRLWIPIIGSFAVYLVPLVGPHAVWFLGESLVQQVTRGEGVDPWWVATNWALAIGVQLAVGLLLAWSIRGSRHRLLTWVPAILLLPIGINMAYLVSIPSYFLIEQDTAPELSAWNEHCFVREAGLMPVRTPATQPVSGVREWWTQRPDQRYALLRIPDCDLADAAFPLPTPQPGGGSDFTLGFQFSTAGGAAILQRFDRGTSQPTWWLLSAPSAALVSLEAPGRVEVAPILSDTADAIAWVERVQGPAPPFFQRVVVQPLSPSSAGERTEISLEPLGPASYTLVGVDTVARHVVLWRDARPALVSFDGNEQDLTFEPGAMLPQASTYLRMHDGWVAWDAYREKGPYQVAWSLAGGAGTHRTNNGRSITSAAVDPSGSFIAISETTTLNIGDARDVVYVIRASDGTDVFRKYLPRYSRSQVVFFAGGFFAYADLTGTHVLKLPT